MLVSVIIPVLNEEKHISTCLSCLVDQTLSKSEFEVIVVDNGSTDQTLELVGSFHGRLALTVLTKAKVTIGTLRNLGADVARGEILAFLDGDCYAERNWLSLGIQLAPAKDGIWGAHYRLTDDATWVNRTWSAYQAREIEGQTSFIPSGDLFIWAEAFHTLRGFNESITTSEDVEICARGHALGFTVMAHKILSVRHADSPPTLLAFYRKNRWHGKSVVLNFIRSLPSTRYAGVVSLTLYTFLLFWSLIASLAFIVHHPAWPAATLLALISPAIILSAWKTRCRTVRSAIMLAILYQTYLLARAAAMLPTPKSQRSTS